MAFQTSVNAVPAPGIAGDFASTNPRHSVTGGPGGIIAGAAGVACGYFAWLDAATGSIANTLGPGPPPGFCHNAHNALITTYLGQATLVVPGGLPFGELFDSGDFWVANNTGNPVTPGLKVYANNQTGAVSAFAAAATPSTAGPPPASTTAAETASVTGSAALPTAGNTTGPSTVPAIMTVTAVGSGTLSPRSELPGTGVPTGCPIVAQLTGTTGGIGTYSISIPVAWASTTVSTTYGLLTVGGTVVSGFAVGQTIEQSGTVLGTITASAANGSGLTGAGGAGTYVTQTQTVSSGVVDSYIGTETAWYVANGSFGNGT